MGGESLCNQLNGMVSTHCVASGTDPNHPQQSSQLLPLDYHFNKDPIIHSQTTIIRRSHPTS